MQITRKINLNDFISGDNYVKPLIAIELTTNSVSLFDFSFPVECSFLVGNERNGIPESLLANCNVTLHIPMFGTNGSMNVATALAIVLFEWRRQTDKTLGAV